MGTKQIYQFANVWKNFTSIIEMTTSIPLITDKGIKLYPNPITDYLYVEGIENTCSMSIVDLKGEVLFFGNVINKEKVSLTNFRKGIYIVKLTINNSVAQQKIIKI